MSVNCKARHANWHDTITFNIKNKSFYRVSSPSIHSGTYLLSTTGELELNWTNGIKETLKKNGKTFKSQNISLDFVTVAKLDNFLTLNLPVPELIPPVIVVPIPEQGVTGESPPPIQRVMGESPPTDPEPSASNNRTAFMRGEQPAFLMTPVENGNKPVGTEGISTPMTELNPVNDIDSWEYDPVVKNIKEDVDFKKHKKKPPAGSTLPAGFAFGSSDSTLYSEL